MTVYLTPFASAAAEASGIKAALRLRGVENTHVVVWGGDGSTCDIGFSGLSAAAERDEDILYVLNDTEATRTPASRVGGDPRGAWTTTTPEPRLEQTKRRTSPASSPRTGSPTSRTPAAGSVPMLRDFKSAKAARAAQLNIRPAITRRACPPRLANAIESVDGDHAARGRVAVLPPLFACDGCNWSITFKPAYPVPVREFLLAQGRFGHLSSGTGAQKQKKLEALNHQCTLKVPRLAAARSGETTTIDAT